MTNTILRVPYYKYSTINEPQNPVLVNKAPILNL